MMPMQQPNMMAQQMMTNPAMNPNMMQ